MPRALALPALLAALGAAPLVAQAPGVAPADFVLAALARHGIVFVGDIHPVAEPKRIVAEVLRRQDALNHVDLLALEVASEQQPWIDRYLASEPEDTTILLEHPRTLRAHWGASREFLAIYRAVWAWNRGRPDHPTRIVAADIRGWPIAPLTTNMAAGGFANRDEWMARSFLGLRRAHPDARILVFMGGYHGLRTGGGEVTVGRSVARFERWFAGWLADEGVHVYSILTDARQESGHGATRVFDLLAARGPGGNYAVPLGELADTVERPMHDVEVDGYRLAFLPDRFPLRQAADGLIVLNDASPITILEAFR